MEDNSNTKNILVRNIYFRSNNVTVITSMNIVFDRREFESLQ